MITLKTISKFLFYGFLIAPLPVFGAGLSLDIGDGPFSARIFQLLALVSVLSIAPSLLVMVTSFTRIAVVMSILRHALGLQQSPPTSVLMALSLFLTGFVMQPVFYKAYESGVKPYLAEKMTEEEALQKISSPFRTFMLKQVGQKELGLFLSFNHIKKPDNPSETPFAALIPAFMISELKRAFEIGFLLFVPFLVIDLIVASVVMAMGMMMLPPVILSLPFKIIFFVLIDGWYLLAGSLIKSYT